MRHSRSIVTLSVALVLLAAGSVALATDVTGNLTFVGITPCRIIDTRGGSFSGQAGPPMLAANANRTFQITGTVPGIPTQCGIPTNAAAISVNFTVTGFTGAGDIRVFPAGGTLPNASILNYSLENIANSTSIPLGLIAAEKGITVRSATSSTNFIADVNGYYVPRPVTVQLSDSAGSSSSTTPVVISSIYSENLRSQGHVEGRLVVRFNNLNQSPACSPLGGGPGTVDLVNGTTVLASVTEVCGFRAWLRYSTPFTLPSGPAALDLRAYTGAGTVSWRSVELELTR